MRIRWSCLFLQDGMAQAQVRSYCAGLILLAEQPSLRLWKPLQHFQTVMMSCRNEPRLFSCPCTLCAGPRELRAVPSHYTSDSHTGATAEHWRRKTSWSTKSVASLYKLISVILCSPSKQTYHLNRNLQFTELLHRPCLPLEICSRMQVLSIIDVA